MSGGGMKGGRRIPTPMPPPKENMQYNTKSSPRLVGSDASYKLSPYEMEALNAVKATAPKMDRNGYFFYVTATAKKKKISLMQPKPPRVAFAEEKRRPGVAERLYTFPQASVAPAPVECRREMTQRGPSPAPRARLYSQLESYQPKYHTIREGSDKRVESDVRRRKKEQRIVYPQSVARFIIFLAVSLAVFYTVQYNVAKQITDTMMPTTTTTTTTTPAPTTTTTPAPTTTTTPAPPTTTKPTTEPLY